jgi:hypothetical protein
LVLTHLKYMVLKRELQDSWQAQDCLQKCFPMFSPLDTRRLLQLWSESGPATAPAGRRPCDAGFADT